MITFDNVTLGYRRKIVLADLMFTVREGEFFGIVGANGSGKTTILRALLGILRPLRGKIVVEPTRFGYVPQRAVIDDIFPLSAREIVMMGRYGALGLFARPTQRDQELVERSLAQTGIEGVAGKRFRDLSGGQKQRVLIARALASEARVFVLDEPTDGMDLEGQAGILELIARLRAQTAVTVVYVTHRLNELTGAAQRLMLLHEGAVRIGPVEDILTEPVLREVYGIPVRVVEVAGKRTIVT